MLAIFDLIKKNASVTAPPHLDIMMGCRSWIFRIKKLDQAKQGLLQDVNDHS